MWEPRVLLLSSLCTPAVLLICFALPHYFDGRAHDAALPVPTSMVAGVALPQGAYRAAAAALVDASPANGDALIARGEANIDAGLPPEQQASLFVEGLRHSPASVRGWSLLALSNAKSDPATAAAALTQASILAPNDFWTAEMRARAAAILWDRLNTDVRENALTQARMLWDEPDLRPRLLILLSSDAGARLIARAFAGRQDDLHRLNRWVSAERRRLATPS